MDFFNQINAATVFIIIFIFYFSIDRIISLKFVKLIFDSILFFFEMTAKTSKTYWCSTFSFLNIFGNAFFIVPKNLIKLLLFHYFFNFIWWFYFVFLFFAIFNEFRLNKTQQEMRFKELNGKIFLKIIALSFILLSYHFYIARILIAIIFIIDLLVCFSRKKKKFQRHLISSFEASKQSKSLTEKELENLQIFMKANYSQFPGSFDKLSDHR